MSKTMTEVDGGGEPTFLEALRRARSEFMEMPGMQLTIEQASRLWACDKALCDAVLASLVESRFLVRTREVFARAA